MSEDVPEQLPNQAPAVDAEWWPAAPVAADEQAATVEPEPPVVEPAPPTVEPAPPTVEPAAAVADATPVPEAAGPAPPAWRPPWATWGRAPADGVPETAHEDPAPAESPEVDPVLAAVTMALGAEPPIPSSLRPDVDIDFDVQWAPEVLAEAETPVTEPSPAEDVPADAPVDAAAAIVVANGVDAQPVRAARRPAPFQWGPGEDHWPPVPSKSPPSPPPPDPPPPAVPLTPRETPDELWDLAGYGKEPADHLDRPRHPRVAALTARWAAKTRGQKVNVVLYALTGVSIVAMSLELLAGPDRLPTDVTTTPGEVASQPAPTAKPNTTVTFVLPPDPEAEAAAESPAPAPVVTRAPSRTSPPVVEEEPEPDPEPPTPTTTPPRTLPTTVPPRPTTTFGNTFPTPVPPVPPTFGGPTIPVPTTRVPPF